MGSHLKVIVTVVHIHTDIDDLCFVIGMLEDFDEYLKSRFGKFFIPIKTCLNNKRKFKIKLDGGVLNIKELKSTFKLLLQENRRKVIVDIVDIHEGEQSIKDFTELKQKL